MYGWSYLVTEPLSVMINFRGRRLESLFMISAAARAPGRISFPLSQFSVNLSSTAWGSAIIRIDPLLHDACYAYIEILRETIAKQRLSSFLHFCHQFHELKLINCSDILARSNHTGHRSTSFTETNRKLSLLLQYGQEWVCDRILPMVMATSWLWLVVNLVSSNIC